MQTPAANERDLRRIMIVGTTLPAGFAAATLQALRPDYSFDFSLASIVAFILGAGVMAACGRIIFYPRTGPRYRFWRLAASIALVLLGVAGFLYPLRFAQSREFPDILTGLAAAVGVLSLIGILLLKLKRFFDADARREERRGAGGTAVE